MARDIWLLMGQSNMEGCGLLKDAISGDPRVFNFTSAGAWETAQEPLHWLWESYTPVNQEIMRAPEETRANAEIADEVRRTRTQGAGLGLPFGIAMADFSGHEIGLIAAAHGGTSLEQWNPAHKEKAEYSLYGALLSRVRKAFAQCPDAVLRGALWYQGETDAFEPDTAATYGARLRVLIEALRADLNAPALPFIAVQLGCLRRSPVEHEAAAGHERYWEMVREHLAQLPQNVPHTACVAAIDLELDDAIHIGTRGLARLGKRMALQAQALQNGAGDISPRVARIEKAEDARGFGALRIHVENVGGNWKERDNIFGFSVHTPDGSLHPRQAMIKVQASKDDPRVLEVLLSAPLDNTAHLAYGMGFMPQTNAVDGRDMALLAFSPSPISS